MNLTIISIGRSFLYVDLAERNPEKNTQIVQTKIVFYIY